MGALRPAEVVFASLRATVRPNRRRASATAVSLLLTSERVLYGTKSLFNHSVEELTYRRISRISFHHGMFSSRVVLHGVPVTLTARLRSKSDSAFIDRIVAGRKAGVAFTLPEAAPASLAPHSVDIAVLTPSVTPATSFALDMIDPLAFEELTRQLLECMGFQARLTKASHDGGIDIEAFDPQPIRGGKIVVQCKKYSNVVGASYVRDLYGVVQHEGATKGILITTSHFSPDARAFAQGKPLELIERDGLEALLRHHGLAEANHAVAQPSLLPVSALPMQYVHRHTPPTTAATLLVTPKKSLGCLGTSGRFLGYGIGILALTSGLGGDPQGYAIGLTLIVLTLLGTDAWGIRRYIPIFNSRFALLRWTGYASLVVALFALPALVPRRMGTNVVTSRPTVSHAVIPRRTPATSQRPTNHRAHQWQAASYTPRPRRRPRAKRDVGGPVITLEPRVSHPGQHVALAGVSFAPYATVHIYWQHVGGPVLGIAKAMRDGTLPHHLGIRVPAHLPPGRYSVVAINLKGGHSVAASVVVR